jgi:hypothetical protein
MLISNLFLVWSVDKTRVKSLFTMGLKFMCPSQENKYLGQFLFCCCRDKVKDSQLLN